MQNDQGTNDTGVVTSAIASAATKPTKKLPQTQEKAPGSFEKKQANVGWDAFSKLPNPGNEVALSELTTQLGLESVIDMYKGARTSALNEQDLVSKFLNEAYYGEWYHNAAVMLFAVVFTWLLTRFGGGFFACLVVGAFLATYYQTSIRRLRRNIRDDIQRELAINRLETEAESADWINHFMSRFWLIYEPVLSAQIIGIADSILVDNTPAFLDSIRLTTFTLGTKAPRIESIKTLTKTEPNVVCMDWKFSFIPNDTFDLSERDLQSKVNPKIVLTIRVGKGMIGAGMPVLVEDLAFSGHLRLKFRMFNEFPHIKTVEASFLERPHFDYSLKPVGGETFGFDINNIPGLESFVQEQVHATLGPMMYAPNVFTLDVAGMMSGATDLNSANGVLVLKIHSASGLKDVDLFGTIDPYITVHVGNANNAELGRTKHIEDTRNPRFDEVMFVLLNTVNDTLVLEVMDHNVGRTDSSIGTCTFDLKSLAESDNLIEGLSLPVLKKGKPSGEVKCDLHYFPVNAPEKQEDGTIVPATESNSGVLRFTVHECKELGGQQKSGGISLPVIGGKHDISPYAVVKVNDMERLRTNPFKRSINPRWDKSVELFVTDKTELNLRVDIMDSAFDDKLLGRWGSKLEEFEEDLFINGQDWWNLKDGSGKLHLSMQWKPITMTGFTESLSRGGYRPPIGVVRVNFVSANDLKNVEAMTGGKSDPYVRVMSGVQCRGQTERIDDNLDPVWNEVIYVPVHSKREDLIFEVMDYNESSKDKSLGITDFFLKDVMREVKNEDGQVVYEATETVERQVDLTSLDRKKGRGTLKYSASFFPTLALAKEDEKKKNEQQQVEEETSGSQASEEPELIEKPKEWPEKDLHNEVIKYKTVSNDKKQIDLLAYESGVLAVTMHTLTLPESHRVVVDLMLDSNDPQYSSIEQKGSCLEINETGTAFVKEMDFSKLIVRVRNLRDADKDDKSVGRCSLEVRKIVERLLQTTEDESDTEPVIEEISLLESNGGKIGLSFKFIPVVQFKLDPAESLENQGNLTVVVVKANNLVAADRSGSSDPFIRFYVNDERVFKTQTYKKTLNPVFNKDETFTVPIINRINTPLIAKIFDWDQIGKDTLIGECKITFTADDVETFVTSTKEYKLDQGGSLTLRLTWRPELVSRKRTNTSFFYATTRVFTSVPGNAIGAGRDVVGAGIGAGGKVLGAGGKAFGSGVSALGSGIRGIGKIGKKSPTISEENDVAPLEREVSTSSSTTSSAAPATNEENANISPSSSIMQQSRSIGDENATIQVNLVEARNLKAMDRGGTSDPYCRVRVGNKVLYKTRHLKKTLSPDWNESFTAKVSSLGTLDFKVKDHNTLTDVDIGDCQLNLGNAVKPGQAFDGWLALTPEGTGEIHVKVAFVDTDSISISSKSGGLFGKK
ncbi:C2 domain-containing protein [Gilbertella persicaria]|uniref:C2 domain-containing protein n=1 Tax=Gilbertella persicaria TaxID=101096 RepID=UPI00221F4224|nr:C2 domain-containing protein [Gilbertella persicaria]KAI8080792.1 C2 domain-containing protein [Gilbertella persicaria]